MTIGTEILQFVSTGVSILGLLVLYFKVILGIKLDIKELQTQIKPWNLLMETELPKILHSDRTPETDVLLEKMQHGCYLSLEEIRELKCRMLVNRANGEYGKWLELPAAMLITHLQALEDKRLQELSKPRKTIWSEIKKCLTLK